jgi:outer membrane protein OmpA-like peptidoglycan-associated protein
MFWKQSIHQEDNHTQKLKTLETAYKRCPLEKIIVDKYITLVYTLSPKDRTTQEVIQNLLDMEMRNQDLDVSQKHIVNNQKKITFLLGRSTEGTLKAVEEVGGIYRADITFDYDSTTLKNSTLVTEIIDKISNEISKSSNATFGLAGGASSDGSASYNKILSQKRADALKEAILKRNPSFDKNINTYDNGETDLVCEGGFAPEVNENNETKCITKEDKEASRRVTIRREK